MTLSTGGRDTIFALSSGTPPAGIAVVRVSGPEARAVLSRIAGRMPMPRQASVRTFRGDGDEAIDRGMVLWLPGPGSATGEDLAEFHLHGGRAVVARMLATLAAMPGCRIAIPGEFTRRAFLNGRIDLNEAEGLGDLLAAETEQQRRAALRMAEGGLSREIERWQATVLGLAAHVEASLDFGDEDDVAAGRVDIGGRAIALADEITGMLAGPAVERLRDGIRVVLAGPPNAGKSSLLNRLVARDMAIVSPIAGTTRDVVEAPVSIAGIAYLFADTAGLRDDAGAVEAIGIARAHDRIADADLLLWLGDMPPPEHPAVLWLFPRSDERPPAIDGRLAISVVTGEGIDRLLEWLTVQAGRLLPRDDALALSVRQRGELASAVTAARAVGTTSDPVLQAEHLRQMRQAFDRLTGRAGFENLLDAVFGQFCLGK